MKGKISIGKVTCCERPEKDYVSIGIEDELSSITFVNVKIDLEIFARALMGLSNCPVELELRGLDRVGKKFEHKTIEVHILHGDPGPPTDHQIRTAIKYYEKDGWKGSDQDARNHHNWVRNTHPLKGSVYRICYCRWVDVEEK